MTTDSTRRDFLKGVAVTGAALAVGSLLSGEASTASAATLTAEQKKAGLNRDISISAVGLLDLTPANAILCAAQAGYKYVGVRLIPAGHNEMQFPMLGDTPMIRDIEKNLKSTGLKVLDCELLRIYPNTRVSSFVPFMETAARLGASKVLTILHDPDFNRCVENYGRLCDLALPYKLNMSLEYMPFADVKNVVDAAKIVKAINRENSGLIPDPLYLNFDGQNSIADLEKAPREYFKYIQFCDAPKERPTTVQGLIYQARHERLSPGKGGLDLVGYLRALPPEVPLAIECCNDTLNITMSALDRAKMYMADTKALLKKAFA